MAPALASPATAVLVDTASASKVASAISQAAQTARGRHLRVTFPTRPISGISFLGVMGSPFDLLKLRFSDDFFFGVLSSNCFCGSPHDSTSPDRLGAVARIQLCSTKRSFGETSTAGILRVIATFLINRHPASFWSRSRFPALSVRYHGAQVINGKTGCPKRRKESQTWPAI